MHKQKIIAGITGMGFVFTKKGFLAAALRFFVINLYKVALSGRKTTVIVQNADDFAFFCPITGDERLHLIPGSGVDTSRFLPSEEPRTENPHVVLPARMLSDKGIFEFVAAARILREEGIKAEFILAGPQDSGNPAAIPEATLLAWNNEGAVHWVGKSNDMPALLAAATVVCLPSYREGMPLALLEAMACKRAVVTCDSIGCRDLVKDELNGLIAPVRSATGLASALKKALTNHQLRKRIAEIGYEGIERKYSKQAINQSTLEVYGLAGG